MVAVVRNDVLKKAVLAVESEGELVVMKFGNVEVKLHYSDALLFSQWIRFRAKEAKRRAGDTSQHWSVLGQLHDAQYGPGHTRG